jgi:hypothetical protein
VDDSFADSLTTEAGEANDTLTFLQSQERTLILNPADFKFAVPTRWFKHPTPDVLTRDLQEEHVNTLMDSFKNTSTINEDVKLVYTFEPGNHHIETELVRIHQRIADGKFDVMSLQNIVEGELMCITGAHTCEALLRLHDKYSRNPRWKLIKCNLYFVPNTPDNIRWMRLEGALNNAKHDKALKMSVFDHIKAMRQRLLEPGAQHATVKTDIMFTTQIKPNTYGQYKVIAVLPEDCWGIVRRLFDEPASIYKNFAKPTATTHFTSIGGVPHADLLQLLREIATSKLTMKQFASNVVQHKLRLRVVSAIMLHCRMREDETWEDALVKYPELKEQAVLEYTVLSMKNTKQRDGMPATMYTSVTSIVNAQETLNRRQATTAVSLNKVSAVAVGCNGLLCVVFIAIIASESMLEL